MSKHEVRDVVCDYGVYQDGELKLILNSRRIALQIVDLLEEDERRHKELNSVERDCQNNLPSSLEILKHRKICDLCFEEKCDEKCENRKRYTYQQIRNAYDEAIGYLNSRPIICPSCGRGCFNFSKYCSHCGTKINKKGEAFDEIKR